MAVRRSAPAPAEARQSTRLRTYRVGVVVRPWDAGGYIAEVPGLQGCWVVADTLEAAVEDIEEVIAMSIESRLERGESLPSAVASLDGPAARVELALAISVR